MADINNNKQVRRQINNSNNNNKKQLRPMDKQANRKANNRQTTDKQAGRFFKKTDTETDTYRLVRGHKPMYGLRKNHPQWLWRQGRPRR